MPGLRSGHQVDLLVGGAEFFPALIAAMDAAQSTVHLETYIFHQDAAGQSVLDALTRAAARGLTVTLVVDDVGTPQWSPGWQMQLQKSGVQWQRFSPLGSLGLLIPGRWRRLHRKLCVVDGQLAFCGGINILDDYFELDHGPQAQARFDFAVRVRGPLVAEVEAAMLQFWWRLDLVRQLGQGHIDPLRRSWEAGAWGPAQGYAASRRAQGGAGGMRAALLLRDNLRHRRRIERAYRQAIARAKTEVLIANAYFCRASGCAGHWYTPRSAGCGCVCSCRDAMNSLCSTTQPGRFMVPCWTPVWKSMSTRLAFCMPKWR